MSIKIMTLVWDNAQELAGSDLLVMLALADWANDAGLCWPSVPRLAKKTRLTDRWVRATLHNLEKMGYLYIEPGRGRKHTNRYVINLNSLQVLNAEKPELSSGLNLKPVQVFDAIKPELSSPNTSVNDPSVEPSGGSRHKNGKGKSNGANKYQRHPSNRERAISDGFKGAFGVPLEQALSGEDAGEDAPYQTGPVHKLPGPRKSA